MTLYGIVSFALGTATGIGLMFYFIDGIIDRRTERTMQDIAKATRQFIAEHSTIAYKRCPQCDCEMLASTVPFVAPGSHN